MSFRVESRTDEALGPIPVRVGFGTALQDVFEVLDRWPGADHRYFRVRTVDGARYIVRLDEVRNAWDLVLFESEAERPKVRGEGSA